MLTLQYEGILIYMLQLARPLLLNRFSNMHFMPTVDNVLPKCSMLGMPWSANISFC